MTKLEVLELEYSDDDILYYIDDEQGNEIGFAVREDGKEVEYYYADGEQADETLAHKVGHAVGKAASSAASSVKNAVKDESLISREQVSDLKNDLNVLYKENAETMKTLRSVAQDMRDFKDFFSGKPLRPRPENTAAQAPAPDQAPVAAQPAYGEAVAANAAPDHSEHKKKKKKKKKDKAEKKEHQQESVVAQPLSESAVEAASGAVFAPAVEAAPVAAAISASAAEPALEIASEAPGASDRAVSDAAAAQSVASDVAPAQPVASSVVPDEAAAAGNASSPDASFAQAALS